jgi:hypothetical protein
MGIVYCAASGIQPHRNQETLISRLVPALHIRTLHVTDLQLDFA